MAIKRPIKCIHEFHKNGIFWAIPLTIYTDPPTSIAAIDRRLKLFSYVMYSAVSIMLVNRITSLITASLYVKRYNQTLNDVLIKKAPKISFTPIPILTPEGMGLALNIRF